MDSWRSELEAVVQAGCESYGTEAVLGVLGEISDQIAGSTPAVTPLSPAVAVLGVSACEAGWVGVLVRPSGQTTLHVGSSLAGLVEQVREQESLGGLGLHAASRRAEADLWLATRPTVRVTEVAQTIDRRAIVAAGLAIPAMYGGMGFVEDELVAACAATVEVAGLWS